MTQPTDPDPGSPEEIRASLEALEAEQQRRTAQVLDWTHEHQRAVVLASGEVIIPAALVANLDAEGFPENIEEDLASAVYLKKQDDGTFRRWLFVEVPDFEGRR